MTLLAIETAAPVGSVAIGARRASGATELLAQRELDAPQRSTTELLPTIQALLAELGRAPRDVVAVCWSRGPGSFTGMRVGATVAAMLRSAIGCEVIGVPTMAAMALRALRKNAAGVASSPMSAGLVVPLLNLRGGHFVAGLYAADGADGVIERIAPATVDLNSWLGALGSPVLFTGQGCEKAPLDLAAFGEIVAPSAWHATAADVLALGAARAAAGAIDGPGEITPLYMRPPECEEVYEARLAAARARRGE